MTEGDTGAPELVLGPLLRYVSETEATIWVETERACEVEILGHQARTFEVAGHHYALVVIGDLSPGTEYEYQVALDGVIRWPEPDSEFPPSVLRTPDPGRPRGRRGGIRRAASWRRRSGALRRAGFRPGFRAGPAAAPSAADVRPERKSVRRNPPQGLLTKVS